VYYNTLVYRRKRGSEEFYLGTDKKEVYLTIKVNIDYTGIFYGKEE